jgi:hypothetical protein
MTMLKIIIMENECIWGIDWGTEEEGWGKERMKRLEVHYRCTCEDSIMKLKNTVWKRGEEGEREWKYKGG